MAEKKDIIAYFDTLQIAQNAIGYSRLNRKHLQRLEEIKEILINASEGMPDSRIEITDYGTVTPIDEFYLSDERLRKVYLRLSVGLTRCCLPGVPEKKEVLKNLSFPYGMENGHYVKAEIKRDLEVVDDSPSPSISRHYLKNLLDRIIPLRTIKSRWNYRKII